MRRTVHVPIAIAIISSLLVATGHLQSWVLAVTWGCAAVALLCVAYVEWVGRRVRAR